MGAGLVLSGNQPECWLSWLLKSWLTLGKQILPQQPFHSRPFSDISISLCYPSTEDLMSGTGGCFLDVLLLYGQRLLLWISVNSSTQWKKTIPALSLSWIEGRIMGKKMAEDFLSKPTNTNPRKCHHVREFLFLPCRRQRRTSGSTSIPQRMAGILQLFSHIELGVRCFVKFLTLSIFIEYRVWSIWLFTVGPFSSFFLQIALSFSLILKCNQSVCQKINSMWVGNWRLKNLFCVLIVLWETMQKQNGGFKIYFKIRLPPSNLPS